MTFQRKLKIAFSIIAVIIILVGATLVSKEITATQVDAAETEIDSTEELVTTTESTEVMDLVYGEDVPFQSSKETVEDLAEEEMSDNISDLINYMQTEYPNDTFEYVNNASELTDSYFAINVKSEVYGDELILVERIGSLSSDDYFCTSTYGVDVD